MSGYVRLYRTLANGHPAFRNDSEAMAFAWMIMRAQWQPVRVRYKDHILQLQRGQLAISVRDFAAAMDRDKAWVSRLLKRLQNEAMIETLCETGVTVITICNYDDYQQSKANPETADETPGETDARQGRDTEEVREIREEVKSEPNGSSPRPFDCPVGVDRQVWKDLLHNRKRKRLSNTLTAWKAFNDDLRRVSIETGIPPPRLIEMCAAKGWGGIYDPRDNRNERSNTDPLSSAVNRILREPNAGAGQDACAGGPYLDEQRTAGALAPGGGGRA